MNSNQHTTDFLGVLHDLPAGPPAEIHLYQGGEYGLEDIVDAFQLGRMIDDITIELGRRDLRQMKSLADAYSFDHEPEFIEMCLEIHRFAETAPGDPLRFRQTF